MSQCLRFRATPICDWDHSQGWKIGIWQRKGRIGQFLADGDGELLTFDTKDDAEDMIPLAREYFKDLSGDK
ncbi:MAG: hypothetical protein AAF292_16375 [Pseudomonadota bacterium]